MTSKEQASMVAAILAAALVVKSKPDVVTPAHAVALHKECLILIRELAGE